MRRDLLLPAIAGRSVAPQVALPPPPTSEGFLLAADLISRTPQQGSGGGVTYVAIGGGGGTAPAVAAGSTYEDLPQSALVTTAGHVWDRYEARLTGTSNTTWYKIRLRVRYAQGSAVYFRISSGSAYQHFTTRNQVDFMEVVRNQSNAIVLENSGTEADQGSSEMWGLSKWSEGPFDWCTVQFYFRAGGDGDGTLRIGVGPYLSRINNDTAWSNNNTVHWHSVSCEPVASLPVLTSPTSTAAELLAMVNAWPARLEEDLTTWSRRNRGSSPFFWNEPDHMVPESKGRWVPRNPPRYNSDPKGSKVSQDGSWPMDPRYAWGGDDFSENAMFEVTPDGLKLMIRPTSSLPADVRAQVPIDPGTGQPWPSVSAMVTLYQDWFTVPMYREFYVRANAAVPGDGLPWPAVVAYNKSVLMQRETDDFETRAAGHGQNPFYNNTCGHHVAPAVFDTQYHEWEHAHPDPFLFTPPYIWNNGWVKYACLQTLDELVFFCNDQIVGRYPAFLKAKDASYYITLGMSAGANSATANADYWVRDLVVRMPAWNDGYNVTPTPPRPSLSWVGAYAGGDLSPWPGNGVTVANLTGASTWTLYNSFGDFAIVGNQLRTAKAAPTRSSYALNIEGKDADGIPAFIPIVRITA
jgi:hypothetical protein